MKKFLAFLILSCLLVACGGIHKPPPPPPIFCGDGVCNGGETPDTCSIDCPKPPPPDHCGNGMCESSLGETHDNCPRDCEAPPPPPPPPEVRPKANPYWPKKMIGPYVGALDPKTDYEQIGKDLNAAGYNSISIFLTSCLGPHVDPWPQKGNGYDYTKLNPVWVSTYDRAADAFAYYNIAIHNKFVDQFHELDDCPGADPFRYGLGLGKDFDPDILYSGVTFGPTKFWWLSWRDISSGKYGDFKCLNGFCKGMELLIDHVIDKSAQLRDAKDEKGKLINPDYTVSWAWANETLVEFNPATNHYDNIKGDRDEIVQWIFNKWKAKGFNPSKKFTTYFDYFARIDGHNPREPYYPAMGKNKGEQEWIFKRYQAHLEIHGMMLAGKPAASDNCASDHPSQRCYGSIALFIENGIDPDRALFSTDGDLRMEAEYGLPSHKTGLGPSQYNTDLKLDNVRGEPMLRDDFMKYWNYYFNKKYKFYIKKTSKLFYINRNDYEIAA